MHNSLNNIVWHIILIIIINKFWLFIIFYAEINNEISFTNKTFYKNDLIRVKFMSRIIKYAVLIL